MEKALGDLSRCRDLNLGKNTFVSLVYAIMEFYRANPEVACIDPQSLQDGWFAMLTRLESDVVWQDAIRRAGDSSASLKVRHDRITKELLSKVVCHKPAIVAA